MAPEFADFVRRRAFANPSGIEVKYFTSSKEDARRYADLATTAFGEGPFTIIEATMKESHLSAEMMVQADGLHCFVSPTEALQFLTEAQVTED